MNSLKALADQATEIRHSMEMLGSHKALQKHCQRLEKKIVAMQAMIEELGADKADLLMRVYGTSPKMRNIHERSTAQTEKTYDSTSN